mmetsp:Transcript_26004/g.23026  ORF Transcript_26004/g.23026 Transcript_26004/m.23026 type:complete len:100 (-) Transcript_26004:185-484(-)
MFLNRRSYSLHSIQIQSIEINLVISSNSQELSDLPDLRQTDNSTSVQSSNHEEASFGEIGILSTPFEEIKFDDGDKFLYFLNCYQHDNKNEDIILPEFI